MANEIQRATADALISTIEDGSIIFDFDGELTTEIAYNDLSSAVVQFRLEQLSNIGSGNVAVADHNNGGGFLIGFTITFQGTLANLPQVDILVDTNTLKRDASGITVVAEATEGVADVPSVVDNQINTTAVAPVTGEYEVQRLSLGGATTGTITMRFNDAGTTAEIATLDTAGIQAACDAYAFIGAGAATVTDNMDGTFDITWTALGVVNSYLVVDAHTTDGSPSFSTITEGVDPVTGVHQADHCTVSPAPDQGSMLFNSITVDYNGEPPGGTPAVSGATVTGVPDDGLIVTTWDDYDDHTPVAVDAGTLVVAGEYQVATVSLADAPTEGTLKVVIDGLDSTSFAFDADSTAVTTALINGSIAWTASGTAPNWTFTANVKAASVTFSEVEVLPLRRSAVVTMSEVQAGEAVATGGGFMLLCAG